MELPSSKNAFAIASNLMILCVYQKDDNATSSISKPLIELGLFKKLSSSFTPPPPPGRACRAYHWDGMWYKNVGILTPSRSLNHSSSHFMAPPVKSENVVYKLVGGTISHLPTVVILFRINVVTGTGRNQTLEEYVMDSLVSLALT